MKKSEKVWICPQDNHSYRFQYGLLGGRAFKQVFRFEYCYHVSTFSFQNLSILTLFLKNMFPLLSTYEADKNSSAIDEVVSVILCYDF